MFCPNCKSQVSEGVKSCPKCGCDLEDAKVETKENAGHSADMAETTGNSADMTGKEPTEKGKKGKKPGKRGWIILASAVGIVVFIAVIGIVVFRKSPEELSDKINAARQSGATSLDLSGVDTGSVVGMHEMFLGCSSLETVYLGDGWTDEWIECVKHAYPEIHFVMK